MLLLTVFVFSLMTIISGVYSVNLMDLPFHLEDGNWLIKAKLTDKSYSFNVNIHEYIHSSNGTIRGKIVAQIDDSTPRIVFYTNANLRERMVSSAAYCTYFSYNSDGRWDYYISALNQKTLLNTLVLIGPSVIFRIIQHDPVWTLDQDDVVRGIKQQSASADLDSHLKVSFYYKDGGKESGLEKPSRVLFAIDDEYSYDYEASKCWFDIYTISRVAQSFDAIVTPKPGMNCLQYLSDFSSKKRKPFPRLTEQSVHFISKIKSNTGTSKKEEVFYGDEKYQLLSVKSSIDGEDNKIITTEAIYDYQLGLEYEFTEEGKCFISPMKLSAPGLVQDSSLGYDTYKLDLNRLLDFDLNYHYLGPVYFEDRDEIKTHAWQINEENIKLGNKTYPNVVTTQYLRENTDEHTDYTLVGKTLNIYDENKSFIDSLTTAYFDYTHEISSSKFAKRFRTQACFPDPKSSKTLQLCFTCPDAQCDSSDKFYFQLQDKVKESIVNTGTISASRIANIELIINSKDITVYVTILDFPNIKSAFERQNMKLNLNGLTASSGVLVDGDEEACLMKNALKYEPFEAIAFCKTEDGNVCQRIDDAKAKLVEDQKSGVSCSVFMTPLKNIYRYSRELSLDNIHEKLAHIKILLDNEKVLTLYQVTDVTKINSEDFHSLFESTIENTRLIEDKVNTISVTDVTDLSACYRKCVHSVEMNCKSFSFCSNQDKVECLLSAKTALSSETSKLSNDQSCRTYLVEIISKYKKISSKKFSDNQGSVQFKSSLDKCASLCYNNDLCKSFQFCSSSCSFAGYYTDSSSDQSEECDIYIPKVLDRFELKGKMIAKNSFHSELNLDADQCAALCHDWNNDEEICQSFAFCPALGKKSSLCNLSQYSSHDANVKLVHSDNCQNYERIKYSRTQQDSNLIRKSKHSGMIFIAIMLFSVSGLVLGVVVSLLFKKSCAGRKNDSSEIYNRNTFSWTKQLDNDRQSVNEENSFQLSSD